MEDSAIVTLYWQRSEQAIAESDTKYGTYCGHIAYGLLQNSEDTQECVSDTWLAAWNAMPPHRPAVLRLFLGKLTRRLSLQRLRRQGRLKRGGGEAALALEELSQCVDGSGDVQRELEATELAARINDFVLALPQAERRVFLCRYWYIDSLEDIAAKTGLTKGHISTMLHRTRKRLCICLQKEGLL